jgi:hypothetical protein
VTVTDFNGYPALPPALAERLRRILNGVSVAPPSEKLSAWKGAARRVVGEIVGTNYSRTTPLIVYGIRLTHTDLQMNLVKTSYSQRSIMPWRFDYRDRQ